MDFEIQEYIVIAITLGCWCVGYVMHQWLPTDNKYIPTVVCLLGAILGFIMFGDLVGVIKGMISGVASTGFDQIIRQLLKIKMNDDELYAMGKGLTVDYDLEIHEDEKLDEMEEEEEEEEYGRQ